jgi:cell division protein FtsW
MAKRAAIDKTLFFVTLLLVFVGLVMVFSASAVMAKENPHYHSAYYFLLRQLAWAVAGLCAMLGLMNVDYRRYRKPKIVFPVVGFTVLLLLSVFFLDRSHNTHRWFKAGPLSFQPSELAKLALILFLAWFLETKGKQIQDWHALIPPVGVTLVFAGLIAAQPDLGTALACFAILHHAVRRRGAHQLLSVSTGGISHRFLLSGVARSLATTAHPCLHQSLR